MEGGKKDAHLPGDGERDALVDRVLRRFFPGIRCNDKKLIFPLLSLFYSILFVADKKQLL
jgi:hypothetical protein